MWISRKCDLRCFMNSNGVRTDVPILRFKDKFVGPQGEEYTALPTAEMLAKRYGM